MEERATEPRAIIVRLVEDEDGRAIIVRYV
jgi:hypothetical protein